MLEDVAERRGLIERAERRRQSRSLGEFRAQRFQRTLRGFSLETRTLSFALCAPDPFLELSPHRFLVPPAALEVLTALVEIAIQLIERLAALLEISIRLFEFLTTLLESAMRLLEFPAALIEILSMSLQPLMAVLDLALERFAGTSHVVETATGNVELIAHLAKHALESGDLGGRAPLQFVSLSCELFSFPCELFTRARKLPLRLRTHGRRRLFRRLHERTPMLVCDGTEDVRCRCAEIGFELAADTEANAIERRTDMVVERR
jgi:hypothetical protein